MTKHKLWLVGAIVLLASAPAFAQYGSNCGNACGIGNDIVTSTIACTLYDTNSGDAPIPCQTNLSAYPTLPATVDPTKFVFTFQTQHPSYGAVSAGWGLNTANALYVDQNTSPTTSHRIITDHLVPGGGQQNGGLTGYSFYMGACQHAFPCPNTDATWTTWPGPTSTAGGLGSYLRITPPNPVQVVPMQIEINAIGHMSATQGHFAFVPLLGLWKSGSFPTTASLPAQPVAANTIAHEGSNAPNGGSWYFSTGTAWTLESSTHPVLQVTTLQITDGSGNVYTCHPDANGNHNPSTRAPQNTCSGTAGNSGVAVIPQYPNWQQSSSTDYRQIEYDSSTGQYALNVGNVLSPPLNSQSTFSLEVYPSASSITGNVTVTATFTLYTDTTHHTPATGTTPITVNYPMTIKAVSSVAQSSPSSFTTDANLPTYLGWAAKGAVNMCSNASATYGLAWWNITQHTWLWLPPSPSDFGEFYTWNYDNSRVMLAAADMFLHKMDGTTWSDWAGTTSFGSTYATAIILPTTSNTNQNVFIAVTPGTTNGSQPNWNNVPVGGSVSNGTVTWYNAGNRTYWNACAKGTGDIYVNAMVLAGGHQATQFSLFTGGADRQRQQTGDASARSGGTTTGLFTRLETDVYCYSSGAPGCSPDNATSGYWGGGVFSVMSTNAGRGTAYMVDSAATFWRTMHDNGTDAFFTSDDQRKRYLVYLLNNTIEYWDFISHQDVGATTTNVLDNMYPATLPYMTGLGMEAVIEWQNVDHDLDPSNTLGLADNRTASALLSMTDFVWTKWFDQTFATEGIHNYSSGYNPKDIQVIQGAGGVGGTTDPFFNELQNMTTPAYSWLYDYCGGGGTPCKLSDGTTYDVAADTMRKGGTGSSNCTSWKCATYSDGQWLHFWNNGVGTPKQLGQSLKWGLYNDYPWRTGTWSPLVDDLTPANNPCWDSATVPCSGSHPFADTLAPYMFQNKSIGYNYQDDPGNEGHFVGDTYSPILNVSSTSAEVQFNSYENSHASSVLYGTTTACTSVVSTEESGYPKLLTGLTTSLQVYVHRFQLTGLVPNTKYYTKFSVTDPNNNTAANSCTSQIFQGSGINFTTLNQTTLSILTTSLPNGSTTAAYNQTLQAAGGIPAYTWSIVAGSGSLPPGLSLNTSTGAITGTPTLGGTYTFTAKVTDSATPIPNTAQQPLQIIVSDLKVTTTNLPAGTSNVAYSATLAATGGTTPYTWTVKLGLLPPGVLLNASTGALTGTPTACANYQLVFQVTDSTTPTHLIAVSQLLTISISGCSPLIITTSTLPQATQNVPYNAQLSATGGTLPYNWTLTSGTLPAGLNLASSGAISGTPTGTGTSAFTVQVTDAASNHANANLSITVVSDLGVVTTALNNCTAGIACTNTVQATGGQTPYTWCIQETSGACDNGSTGALPAGLTLSTNNNNAIISGTTTAPGTFSFTVQVTDSTTPTPQVATGPLSITVIVPLVITTQVLPGGTIGFPYSAMLTAVGGYPPYTWCVVENGSTCDNGGGGGLPAGVTIDPNSGALSGVPTMTGIFTPTFRVQDSHGQQAPAVLGIIVSQPLVLHTNLIGAASLTGTASLTPQ